MFKFFQKHKPQSVIMALCAKLPSVIYIYIYINSRCVLHWKRQLLCCHVSNALSRDVICAISDCDRELGWTNMSRDTCVIPCCNGEVGWTTISPDTCATHCCNGEVGWTNFSRNTCTIPWCNEEVGWMNLSRDTCVIPCCN